VVRLFNLDAAVAEAERTFRSTLADLERSLESTVQLTESPDVSMHAGAFFAAPRSPRLMLPEFAGDDAISGTLPDVTLGGVVFGVQRYRIEEELTRLGVDVVPRLFQPRYNVSSIRIDAHSPSGGPLFLLRSRDLINWLTVAGNFPSNGVVNFDFQIEPWAKGHYFRTSDIFEPLPPLVAPDELVNLTVPTIAYELYPTGQPGTNRWSFPAAGQYQVERGSVTEVGTYSDATRDWNVWSLRITPDPGQNDAQPGILELNFTTFLVGTWSFTPQFGIAQSGAFKIVPLSPEPPDDGQLSPGKTLILSYPNGGGEKFDFTSATTVSYEDGVYTGTYVWDAANRRLNVALGNGWLFEITIPSGGNSATVVFRENAAASPVVDLGTYVLR
jgi:hypothetical protein